MFTTSVLFSDSHAASIDAMFRKMKHKNIKTCRVKNNVGFGYGLRKGLLIAKGKIVIYSHADLEVDPSDVTKSIKLFMKDDYNKKIFIKGNRIKKIKNHWTYSDIFFSYAFSHDTASCTSAHVYVE